MGPFVLIAEIVQPYRNGPSQCLDGVPLPMQGLLLYAALNEYTVPRIIILVSILMNIALKTISGKVK